MSERIHALAQLLLGKSSIEECSLEEIKQLTENHPYFAPAQFLLLQKLKSESSSEAEAQRQKAILYYHDPIQFDYFVSPEKFYVDESFLESPVNYQVAAEDSIEESRAEEDVVENSVDSLTEKADTLPEASEVNDEYDAAELQSKEEPGNFAAFETISEEIAVDENLNAIDHAEADETILVDQPESELGQEISADEEIVDSENSDVENRAPASDDPAMLAQTELPPPVEQQVPSNTSQDKPAPVSATNEVLAFEPFHTVDYFASQGIKVSVEEAPKDKLGKQLRSFTEWLKVMKRLPVAEMTKTPETTAEKTVEKLATHSVADNDVVTEAMAEVWAKQGAHEKAIETYNKLCLLNPSKRAYFAARIEKLKQS